MSDTAPQNTGGTEDPQGTEGGSGSENAETPTVEELLAKVEELTGHSRKWEDRAKANKEKADRLDEIEREKMTDAERASADLSAAHAERDEAVERAEKAEAELARYKIATEFGLSDEDVQTLASIKDEETLRTLAERLAGRSPSGPRPDPAQGRRGTKPKPSTPKDAFVAALEDLL